MKTGTDEKDDTLVWSRCRGQGSIRRAKGKKKKKGKNKTSLKAAVCGIITTTM